MVLGIDIDDTITNTTEKALELLKKYPQYEFNDDYHNMSSELLDEFLNKNVEEIQKSVILKEDVISTLKYFKDIGIKIVFITMRGYNKGFEKLIPLTCNYFAKNYIPYDEIVFGKKDKGLIAKEKGVSVFIDDKEEVLDDVKKYGIKTLRMSENNEKSNHEIVTNWKEVKTIIEKLLEVSNGG